MSDRSVCKRRGLIVNFRCFNDLSMTVKLLKHGRLVTYKDLPHGCCQTHPDIVNADILAFIREEPAKEPAQASAASETVLN